MSFARYAVASVAAFALASCGGGGGSDSSVAGGSPSPTPTPTTSGCSVADRQAWSKSVIDEWYLFPDLVNNSVNPASFSTVQDYLDALVAPARAESKDRFFTYITSKSEEEALINSGSSAGFGIRLGYDTVNNRVFVLEAYENAPAFGFGMDRGTQLTAIGTTSTNLQSVSSLMASGGPQAVINALGPSDAGLTRVLQFTPVGGAPMEASIAKADFALDPVSNRYGVQVIDDNGKKVGYLNLRTFIVSGAGNELRNAFQQFRSQGVTELIIDLRYNGGGLVSVAEIFGDLMGRNNVGQVFSRTVLRPSKSNQNETNFFSNESNAIAPTKIAFIGFGGTASASELVANSMIPYLGNNTALVGGETFGKPVGQFGFDRDQCDDRLRVLAFQTENANGDGEYFEGLSGVFPNTCRANDDIFRPLGDPQESSVAAALDFLAGRSCTPITGKLDGVQSTPPERLPLQPARPNAAQHELPGLF